MEGFFIQPYDILMLGVLVGLAVLGACKGVAWQIAALSSLVVSWIVAVRFAKVLAPYISDNEPWNGFIAMLLLYLGTSLAIWSFFRLVKGMIDRVQLKDFDRQMGALFGLVKGMLWCLLITFFAVTLSETTRQWVLQSRSGYYAALLIRHGTPILPEDVRNVLGKYIKRLDDGLGEGPEEGQESLGEGLEEGLGESLEKLMVNRPVSDLRQGLEERIVNTPVSELRQGSGDLASELKLVPSRTAANFRDEAQGFLDSRAGEFESRIGDTSDRVQGELREAMRQGFDELDSRIKRLPLEPVAR